MPKAAKSKKPAAPKKGVKKAKSFSTKDEKIEIKENVVEDELAEDNTIPPITTPGPIENYLLYIELLDIDDPCITRTLSVPSWYSFADLSEVIQTAFDWSNMHMHKFEIDLRNEELKVCLKSHPTLEA
ncbi:hypothetical protein EJ08DRAFT_652836 [Tothia fuscella]|uniref:Plasmid pRiA4b Orf3-like domain-containing protein n=1 Tax=Tothia fuscella TaxID=1048955 RepID=A0A9P4TUP8_9PEZI|nr:hypothetical protein EJ08DRAFT_652836 [Tothia fuscella]